MTSDPARIGAATRSHYDRYSYDFETAEHADMQLGESLLGEAIAAIGPNDVVLDGGCGTGLVSRLLRARSRAHTVVAIDLSLGSIHRARAASSGVAFAQGNLLQLPVRTGALDLALSRGVIMTTGAPERAFGELVRATRPGGRVYVRVYNARHPYRWLYATIAPICRAIAAIPGGKALLAVFVVPPFWLVLQLGVVVLRRRVVAMSPRVLWNIFADQFLVPHNSFHTIEEVRAWGRAAGCTPAGDRTITLGQQIELLFTKNG
jgi:SAM-dependent methyltransferase